MSAVSRMPLVSADILAERVAALRQLFPDAVTEGKIDFERLRQALGDEVAKDKERYELTWAGKSEAKRILQQPGVGTLAPMRGESVNFDATENMIIEGDNLETLKLLQKDYAGRIKMIYIDPPYNTGNEFIYPDNFREGLQDYLRYSGQVKDEQLQSTNTERTGQIHSKWLSMIYPRLFLAKNLLREDGVIFVSIDDNEVHTLRSLMDELFGEENFVAQIVWQARQSIQNDTDISENHEYIISYARRRRQADRRLKEANADKWYTLPGFAAYPLPLDITKFANPDSDSRGLWKADPFDAPNVRPNLTYAIENSKTGEKHWPPLGRCWRTDENNYKSLLNDNRIVFGKQGDTKPQLKVFYEEKKNFGEVENTWFTGNMHSTATHGTKELTALFDGKDLFDSPKPVRLLKSLLLIASKPGDLILDFFAGSGTTGQAVCELNKEDGGNRKFILVQLPEKTSNPQYPTIAHITRERLRKYFS